MKKLASILAATCCMAVAMAQSVTIRFEGANNPNATNTRNFAIDIDGKTYYSANADAVGSSAATQLVVGQPGIGTHQLAVYGINENENVSNTKGEALYTNTFRLRSGYDMIISIRRNGQVAFTEKKSTIKNTNTGTKTAMSETSFNKLLEATKVKWSQTSRYTAVKTAFNTKANYFTTDQAGELLMLISAESKRLELAKLAYPKVTDQENFGDMSDLFTVQTNKDNITKFYQTKNPQAVASNETNTTTGRTPLSTSQFNQLMTTVRNQYQQAGKYAVIKDAFNTTEYYFTSSQTRQLLTSITNETEKLELAKLAYARVSDQSNFNTVYNLFTTQANRDELANFVRYGETTTSSSEYSGRTVMSSGDFSKLQMKARMHIRQASVTEDVRLAFSDKTNYFSIDQIRSLLSLIGSETDRLTLAKLAYHRAVDPTSFSTLSDMFTTQANIDALNTYIRNNKS